MKLYNLYYYNIFVFIQQKKGDFPITEQYYERAITLPLFPKMTDEELEYVIESVKEIVDKGRS